MAPTKSKNDIAALGEAGIGAIAIDLQDALEAREVSGRANAPLTPPFAPVSIELRTATPFRLLQHQSNGTIPMRVH